MRYSAQALSLNRSHKAALQGLANLDATFRKQSQARPNDPAVGDMVGLPNVPGIGAGATTAGFSVAAYDGVSGASGARQGPAAA